MTIPAHIPDNHLTPPEAIALDVAQRRPREMGAELAAKEQEIALLKRDLETASRGESTCYDDDGTPFAGARYWRAANADAVKRLEEARKEIADLQRYLGGPLDDASRGLLAERDALSDCIGEMGRILGADDGEYIPSAARRVVKERDEAKRAYTAERALYQETQKSLDAIDSRLAAWRGWATEMGCPREGGGDDADRLWLSAALETARGEAVSESAMRILAVIEDLCCDEAWHTTYGTTPDAPLEEAVSAWSSAGYPLTTRAAPEPACVGPWMPAPGFHDPYGPMQCETHGLDCPAGECRDTLVDWAIREIRKRAAPEPPSPECSALDRDCQGWEPGEPVDADEWPMGVAP